MGVYEDQNWSGKRESISPLTVDSDSVDECLDSVSTILSTLAVTTPTEPLPEATENQIATVKLGIASSLFQALRVRHAPTALHSLRVAYGCSVWGRTRTMDEPYQHALEIAALMHDIGKLGAPDTILKQPTTLTTNQAAQIFETRHYGLTILSACCDVPEVLECVAYAGAWFDGSRQEFQRRGKEIPLGARMISIVDAFDAMTTDRVYRKALTYDQALTELFKCASSQFDPDLVRELASLFAHGQLNFQGDVAARWLATLEPQETGQLWRLQLPENDVALATREELQSQHLFQSIHEGAFFLDPHGVITHWNTAATRLTGISEEGIVGQTWDPSLLKMKLACGRIARYQDCPIVQAIETGHKSRQPIMVRNADGDFLHIELYVVPVVAPSGFQTNVLVLMRDETSRQDLEERVTQLHRQAMSDPLTGVANRAEFDRQQIACIEKHVQQGTTCSLIICDIDRFKLINDDYGHQAGDEALISFAKILQRNCREGDLVARYGGEEFVMVCEECSLTESVKIAESIRQELERTSLGELGGKSITASFGVTELQPGDSDESMLRRADRGLLKAKDTGRNKVVQLGSGMTPTSQVDDAKGSRGWWPWSRSRDASDAVKYRLNSNVPLPLIAEKLRGFVSDHKAEITTLSRENVTIQVTTENFKRARRSSDRPVTFRMELQFQPNNLHGGNDDSTSILVELTPLRIRDRRTNVAESAKMLLRSLQAYLMAQTVESVPPSDQANNR